MSLPTRGAWIETPGERWPPISHPARRSPHGERGLKRQGTLKVRAEADGRSPHGERGLKQDCGTGGNNLPRRSPHGERGLKLKAEYPDARDKMSLPTWGAWIETIDRRRRRRSCRSLPTRGAWIETLVSRSAPLAPRSLPTRGAWIETLLSVAHCACAVSLPTRGAWIETEDGSSGHQSLGVAPHTGSVD